MINTILFVVGLFFVVTYGLGFLTKQEFKTHTNLRIIIHWIIALGSFYAYEIPSIHLLYTFPLGIVFAFAGIKFVARGTNPTSILITSALIWGLIMGILSITFGTFI